MGVDPLSRCAFFPRAKGGGIPKKRLKSQPQYLVEHLALNFSFFEISIDRIPVKLRVLCTVVALGFPIQWSGEELAF